MQVPRQTAPRVRDQAVSGAKFDASAPIEAFGGGAALQRSTDAIGNLAKAGGSAFQEVKNQADQRAVMDAVNGFQNHENELQVGEKGFLKVKGKDALGITATYQDLAKKKYDELAEGLSNDDQRYMFKQNADKIIQNLKFKTETHAMQEYGKYQDQSDSDGIETWTNTALLNYGDKAIVADALNKKNGHILAMAERKGMDEAQISKLISETDSKVRLGITMRIMQDQNATSADAYFNQHKKSFTAQDMLTAQKSLETKLRDEKATALSDSIFDKEGYTDVGAAYERAKEIGDVELRDATMSKLKVKIAIRDNQVKEDHSKLIVDVSNHIEKGGDINQLPPDIVGRLSPKERKALVLRREQVIGAAEVKPNLTTYSKYDSMSVNEIGNKTLDQLLIDARPSLTNDQWNRVRNKWEAAQGTLNGDKKSKDAWAGFQNEDDSLFRSMQTAKIAGIGSDTIRGKLNEEQKLAYQNLQNEMADQALLWSQANGGKKPDTLTVQKIASDVVNRNAMKIYIDGNIWDSEKSVGELSESDRKNVYIPFNKIPENEVKMMFNVLKANNQLRGMDEDEAMSAIKNPNSPFGKTLKQRMQKAYGQGTIGNRQLIKQKLLGQ